MNARRLPKRSLFFSLAFVSLASAVFASCDLGAPDPVFDLPARPVDALGGTELAREVSTLDLDAREERIYAEISRGNVPSWLGKLRRVQMTGEVEGHEHRVTFWVTPDYLSVGPDSDFFLFPLSPQTGQRVADLLGGSLPTTPMVDAIWRAAQIRLAPIRIQPSMLNLHVDAFMRHDDLVRAQRQLHGVSPGALVAGHKKDVVVTAALSANPGNVAVYGWHRPEGSPIQSLNTSMPDSRVDYNHGIRLVHREVLIDGEKRDLEDVLRDPGLAPLLSGEGAIAQPRYSVLRVPNGLPSGDSLQAPFLP